MSHKVNDKSNKQSGWVDYKKERNFSEFRSDSNLNDNENHWTVEGDL